jgi:hypothetical protein
MLLFLLPFVVAYFALFWVVGVFFLLNLRDLLEGVSPQNRAMSPGKVWLNFIPIFNIVWIFITVIRVRDSLWAEFQSRGWAPRGDFGYSLGIAAAILSIVNWGLFGLAALVCWIVYWVRMSEIKNLLRQAPAGWLPAQQWTSSPTAPAASGATTGTCPYCGAMSGPGARFCRSCGRSIV